MKKRAAVKKRAATMRQRAPRGGGVAIWDLVIDDMRARDNMGAVKYGQRLRARDGRDTLVDAYQEVLDLAVYLRKELFERDGR